MSDGEVEPVKAPRVYISASDDSPAHCERVLELATRLRADGIDAWLDDYEQAPAQGWARWLVEHVQQADFVLLICTAEYRRRFEGRERAGTGRRANFAGMVATHLLYDGARGLDRIVPVVFEGHDADVVPNVVRAATAHVLWRDYDSLTRHLLTRPAIVPPPLGVAARVNAAAQFEGPLPDPRFTGRTSELAELEQLIQANRSVCVVAAGIGGMGKTTLVSAFVERRARELYPEGVAWIDGSPELLVSQLARVANRFGFRDAHERDATPEEAVRWLKTALAPRRALIVIDSFDPERSNPEHVPIPGGDSRTIVTSRDITLDLRLNAKRLKLGLWPIEVCRAYLREHCLDCRWMASATNEQLDPLAEFVGRLPLGMRLLVSVLRNRAGTPAHAILVELRTQPLGTLDRYDANRGVAATFQCGYDNLPARERRALQALAACARQTRAEIIAAVAELADIAEVREALDYLHTHGFAELHEDGRWGLHDVVRLFVLAQPGTEELATRQLAWVRAHLQDYADPTAYQRFAEGVEEAKHAFFRLLAGDVAAATAAYSPVESHLARVGHNADAIALSKALLEAAPPGSKESAIALNNLGLCYATLGEVGKAIDHFDRALAIDEKLGHLGGQASQLGNLGICCRRSGKVAQAIEYHERARAICETLGSLEGQADQIGNLGSCYLTLGEIQKAIEHFERVVNIDEQLGRLEGQANGLGNLGLCYLTLGEVQKAFDHFERALAIDEKLGRLEGQANQLANLGLCYEELGDAERARGLAIQARDLYRRMGLPDDHPHVAIVQRALDRLA